MNKYLFSIGNKLIGDGSVLIQSMGDRKTTLIDDLINLTNHLSKMGLDMMRFSVLDEEDARALKIIKSKVSIPIIADIHYSAKLALLSIEAGVDKIRINPGNMPESALRNVINAIKEKDLPIRIGVNSGSLNEYKGKGSTPDEDYFLALDKTLSVFEQEGLKKIVLSLKSSDPKTLTKLYLKANEKYPYPLHIGLTESGFGIQGSIKSALAIAPLLEQGIGDTIRISLADNREEELRACKTLLKVTGRRKDIPELIVCPTCGRTAYDLKDTARKVQSHLDTLFKEIKVAVMGCPVNGLGEGKDADLGIAGTGQEHTLLLFAKGKPLGTYNEKEALKRLFELIDNF